MNLFVIILAIIWNQHNVRVLDIYAPSKNDRLYVKQILLLKKDTTGLKERDMVIRHHFNQRAFKVILTGKDGGEKYSSTQPLTLEKLYAIIDVMPMRREEMIRKKRNLH